MPKNKSRQKRKQRQRAKAGAVNIPRKLWLSENLAPVQWIAAAAEDDSDSIKRFSMVAYTGAVMHLGYYGDAIVDLRGLQVSKKAMPIFLNHDSGQIVGHSTTAAKADGKVTIEGVISGTGDAAQEVVGTSENKFPWQASIGAEAIKAVYLEEGESAVINGQDISGPLTWIKKARLFEVSFVPLGADKNTKAKVAASAASPEKMEVIKMKFAEWLKAEFGLDAENLSAEQVEKFQARYEVAQEVEVEADADDVKPPVKAAQPEPVDPESVAQVAEEKERKRAGEIIAACAGFDEMGAEVMAEVQDIRASAIDNGKDVSSVNAQLIKLVQAKRPAAQVNILTTDTVGADAVKAAVTRVGGMGDEALVKSYGEKAVTAADKLRGINSIQEVFRLAAAAEGKTLPSFSGSGGEFIRAAFSTVSGLSGILGDSANKTLLDGYNFVEQAWREVCSIASVKDFKQHTRYRLSDSMQFEKIGPDGEIKHGAVGQLSYVNQADTFAKMFSLTRQDIINDDLGAFLRIPRALGIGAAESLNSEVWTSLLSNPSSFFSTTNLNLVEGTAYALSIAGLTEVEKTFLDQTKPNGTPLGYAPSILLVPTALKVTAEQLYNQTMTNETTTANKPQPMGNPHAGKFRPVTSAYLGNASYTGYSTTAYYLFADPRGGVSAIEVAFLNGVENPTIESAEANFNTLGMEFRGWTDFGVAMQDYRAAVKATGEVAAS